jgi:outer membrane lipoprotein LolB
VNRAALVLCACLMALAGCATHPVPALPPASPWAARLAVLQQATSWELDGRAAVALGNQGWQASLLWRQSAELSEVHLTGPFGVGALVIELKPDGLWLNGVPPGEAVLAQLRARLGFDPPLSALRYWLLGVPEPASAFDLSVDRAQHLEQDGWTVDYERYAAVGGDVLPDRLSLTREGVRVRIVVDHWTGPRDEL